MFNKILIVGLGLIGASFAKYLRLKDETVSIVAIDTNLETCRQAVKYKTVDQAVSSPELLGHTKFDLVIIASPLDTIVSNIETLSTLLDEPCLFIDFGSTKKNIKDNIHLKKLYHVYVGAHPLTGWHRQGYKVSDPSLFENIAMVLTGTEQNALKQLAQWFKRLNLRVLELSEQEHDKLLALSSHIPYFMSLLTLAPLRDLSHIQKKMLKTLVAGGFKDTTRVSQSSLDWALALCKHNSQEILPGLKAVQQHLEMLIDVIEQEDMYGLEVLIQVLAEERSRVIDNSES